MVCLIFRAALVSGVAVGLANPTLGCLADKYSLSKFSTFGIFIISGKKLVLYICFFCTVWWDNPHIVCYLGLTLRSDEIGAATEAWPVGLFGLVWLELFGCIIIFIGFSHLSFFLCHCEKRRTFVFSEIIE